MLLLGAGDRQSVSVTDYTSLSGLLWWPRTDTGVLNGAGSAAAFTDPVGTVTDAKALANLTQATNASRPLYNQNTYQGKASPELLFNGAGAFMAAGNVGALAFDWNVPWTMTAIVRLTSNPSSGANAFIITKQSASALTGWAFSVVNTGTAVVLRAQLANSATNRIIVNFSGSVVIGVPVALTISHDGTGLAAGIKGYANGSALAMTPVQDNLGGLTTVAADEVQLSGRSNGVASFPGGIAQPAIYNRALAPAEARGLAAWQVGTFGGP